MEAPEFFQGSSYCSQFPTSEKPSSAGDHFIVEDLLDFSNDEAAAAGGGDAGFDSGTGDSSTVTVVDSCNSSSLSGGEPNFGTDNVNCRNLPESHFSGDLCVPCDDLAELEWLSNFVEESFSSEDLQKLQLISGMKTRPDEFSQTRGFQPAISHQTHHGHAAIFETHYHQESNNPVFNADVAVPAKARSKRSRSTLGNWASRLLVVSPTSSSSEPEITVVPTPMLPKKQPGKTAASKKKAVAVAEGQEVGSGEGRKCLHCATDKTPQWRTGPMGPKTLCNACGVRYKSGRLVPEYRPAASPTFVLTKHSNSHRKVMELRRQKDMVRAAQHQHQHQHQQHQQPPHFMHHHQGMLFDVSNGDDYLIHQHVGPDFRQLI